MKHEEGTGHVGDVGETPRSLLGNVRDNVEDDFQEGNDDKVNGPGTYCPSVSIASFKIFSFGRTLCIDPFRVEVGQGGLITHLLQRLGWFGVH